MGTGDLSRVPQQQYDTGEPGKVQGRDRVWIEEWSWEFRIHAVSIPGTFDLSRNPRYKTGGRGRPVAKGSSDPRRDRV